MEQVGGASQRITGTGCLSATEQGSTGHFQETVLTRRRRQRVVFVATTMWRRQCVARKMHGCLCVMQTGPTEESSQLSSVGMPQ